MAWMWARLKARTTRLGTFEGGFQRFADRFAERLREMGVDLRLGDEVKSIRREADGRLEIDVAGRPMPIRPGAGDHLAHPAGAAVPGPA